MLTRLNLHKKQPLQKTRGAALITALFIMALVAAAAVILALQQSISIRRTQILLETDQAYLYNQAVTYWAIGLLKSNVQKSTENAIIDYLPKSFPDIKRLQNKISGHIDDMQGKFNLNNLTQKGFASKFEKLIKNIDPTIKDELAHRIALATQAWITQQNEDAKQDNDFDQYYLKLDPPYRTAHYPMASPSELRLVQDVGPELYRKLEPYITALPTFSPINVNTVSAEVLSAISSLSTKDAESILKERDNDLFKSAEEFMKNSKVTNAKINIKDITTISGYFLVTATVQSNKNSVTTFSLLKREVNTSDEQNDAELTILWVSHGAW